MMNKLPLAALLAAMLLGGCGSDSETVSPSLPEPEQPKPDFLTVDVKPNAKFEGEVTVYLGRYDDRLKDWLQANPELDLNGDGHVDERDAHLHKTPEHPNGVFNEPETYYTLNAADIAKVLSTNPDGLGAGSARDDIFVDGHYSVFDLLRYLVYTRKDLRFDSVTLPLETGRDTHEFVLSWDRNKDGIFDELDGNVYSNFQTPDWHARIKSNGGVEKKLNGTLDGKGPQGEGHYERLDQFVLQPGMSVRFQPFSPEMTQRRQWVQDREMARLAQNGGKVIVPKLMINKPDPANIDDRSKDTPMVIENLEVTAHNMRPDIFKPGVITKMDVFLSARQRGVETKFNYWPTLSTGAKVDHFALFSVDGIDSQVGKGWTTVYGEMAVMNDFKPNAQCNFGRPESGGMELEVDSEHCRLDWNSNFGGNVIHVMSDVWVMNQPVEFVMTGYLSHYPLWGMEEFNGQESKERDFSESRDGSDIAYLQVFDLPSENDKDAPVLTKAHFGWKIADCTECHNESKEPLGHGGHSWPINNTDGFSTMQPYYCATCHGSNGAPFGHKETARCFWCHTGESNTPKHHGDASTKKLYRKDALLSNDKIYNHPDLLNVLPRDKWGNYEVYDNIWHSKNSDWNMSDVFPDPYSCMTCHPDKS
ncbi:hypothetical protein [uncultured Shewanella sp.]|uniref:hypothetical protein n=1 Tax=uncultured Shewanella sp. TaxID=173975 RepID=UPI002633EADD|nr:hypothetical protein [uncultured Shewanella sp.]